MLAVLCIFRWILGLSDRSSPLSVLFEVKGPIPKDAADQFYYVAKGRGSFTALMITSAVLDIFANESYKATVVTLGVRSYFWLT